MLAAAVIVNLLAALAVPVAHLIARGVGGASRVAGASGVVGGTRAAQVGIIRAWNGVVPDMESGWFRMEPA
jgi:hypothetical protein